MTEELLLVFTEVAGEKFPGLDLEKFARALREEAVRKKFDVQDETLLDAALRDDRKSFADSLAEALEQAAQRHPDGREFLSSEEGRNEAVSILLKSAEHTIDYYYNSIIGKHFSAS